MRFSVTDRCNLRCRYCRSPMDKDIPHPNVLRYEEILDLVGMAHGFGIEKVRLTGGEPFVRKGFMGFLRELRGRYPALDVRVTTNATLARPHVLELKELGLNGVNISLDSFDREKFAAITGHDGLPEVLRCVDAFMEADIKVKINAVAMRGVNDGELGAFLDFARKNPVDVRFIEFMPMGENTLWNMANFWSAADILAAARQLADLSPAQVESNTRGPAKLFQIEGGLGRLGLITPLSNHFCGSCNRLRITSDGNLRTCLFADREYRLRPILRHPKLGMEAVRRIFELAGKCKPIGAAILENRKKNGVARKHMDRIGG